MKFNDPVNVDRFSLLQLILTLLYDGLDLHFLPGGILLQLFISESEQTCIRLRKYYKLTT